MGDFLCYQRRVFAVIAVVVAAGAAAMFCWQPDRPDYLLGWTLGGLAGLAVFRLRVMTIVRLPDLPKDQWRRVSLKASFFNYALLAVVVVVAMTVDLFNPVAVIAGLVLERAVLIADGFLRPAALAEQEADDSAPDATPPATEENG